MSLPWRSQSLYVVHVLVFIRNNNLINFSHCGRTSTGTGCPVNLGFGKLLGGLYQSGPVSFLHRSRNHLTGSHTMVDDNPEPQLELAVQLISDSARKNSQRYVCKKNIKKSASEPPSEAGGKNHLIRTNESDLLHPIAPFRGTNISSFLNLAARCCRPPHYRDT